MSAKSAAPSRGNRSFITILAAILVLGAGVIGYLVTRPKAAAVVIDPNAPPPRPQGYVKGSADAPAEIVMFGDFECPGCGRYFAITEPDVITRLVNTGLVRYRFVDYPIAGHQSTMFAHNAAACANAQGKFWEMHDRLYAGQLQWSQFANGRDMNAPKVIKRYAKDLGLNTSQFDGCLDGRQFEAQVLANAREAERIGVGGTPSFLIGKRLMPAGIQPYDVLKALVDSATAEAKADPKTMRTFGDTAKGGTN